MYIVKTPFPGSKRSSQIRSNFALQEKFSCPCSLYTLVLPSAIALPGYIGSREHALLGDITALTFYFCQCKSGDPSVVFWLCLFRPGLWVFGNTIPSENSGLFASKQLLVSEIMAKEFFFPKIEVSTFIYFFTPCPLLNLIAVTVKLYETIGLGGRNALKLFFALVLNSSV